MPINNREWFDSISHAIADVGALIGAIILLIKVSHTNTGEIIVLITYSISMLYMFGASALYHYFKKKENEISFWRKFDHVAIYFMIAGSYTAIAYLFFSGIIVNILIICQWAIVIIGGTIKIIKINQNRWIDVSIYILMGWMALLAIKQIIISMNVGQIILLVTGGVAYTIGAIISTIKKPKLIKGIVEAHEIFHILIIIGALLHYLLIISFL